MARLGSRDKERGPRGGRASARRGRRPL